MHRLLWDHKREVCCAQLAAGRQAEGSSSSLWPCELHHMPISYPQLRHDALGHAHMPVQACRLTSLHRQIIAAHAKPSERFAMMCMIEHFHGGQSMEKTWG